MDAPFVISVHGGIAVPGNLRSYANVVAGLLLLMMPSFAVLAEATTPLRKTQPQTGHYQLAWQVSSDDVLFGNIADVDQIADGSLIVTDVQLGQVVLINAEGGVDGVVAVQGEGPGRVTRLSSVRADDEAGLLLAQFWPSRVERVQRNGTPLKSMIRRYDEADHPSGFAAFDFHEGSMFAVQVEVHLLAGGRERNTITLCALDQELMRTSIFHEAEFTTISRHGCVDETQGWFPLHAWTAIDKERVVVAPERERYLLLELLGDGKQGRSFYFPADARLRRESEIENFKAGYTLTSNGVRQEIDFKLYDKAEMIESVVSLGDERLLLKTSLSGREEGGRTGIVLDLVDMAAGTISELETGVPFDPDTDRVVLLRSGDLAVLKNSLNRLHALDEGGAGSDEIPTIMLWREK